MILGLSLPAFTALHAVVRLAARRFPAPAVA
jgi:hypothetical protein